jgi:predicted nucleic acid-binding protein
MSDETRISNAATRPTVLPMYLIDTNVISEMRKAEKADAGVRGFFARAAEAGDGVYLSSITIGELRRGVELLRYRGDLDQAARVEAWLQAVIADFRPNILPLDAEVAQVWGRLRAPNPDHALDKQIAATALIYDLTLVSRNVKDFQNLGVRLLNPFAPA